MHRYLAPIFLLLSALAGAGWPVHAQPADERHPGDELQPADAPLPPNPFSRFESFRLPNGLKVWYAHLPGSTMTSMAVIVPYGRDRDPRGREQTAHFLEHVLLSDRQGRQESELARELARRGGSHNAMTGHSYTQFLLDIGTAEAEYGVQWLHDVIAPRLFSDDLVQRNRQPVALEVSTRDGALLPGVGTSYISHPRLRPPMFWLREFGIAAQEERGADQRAGIAAITAADLRAFYDSYYSPSSMTLVLITGVPRIALQPALDSTFGTLPWRPSPAAAEPPTVRRHESRAFTWHVGESTRLSMRFRIADLDGRDQLRLLFIEDLLRHRLMERLRRGEAKLIYSISAGTAIRGPVAFFGIQADLAPRNERPTRAAIAAELDRLARAAEDTIAFYADRDVLSRRVRMENASPGALRQWATDRFYRPDLQDGFPDIGEYYATVGPDSIAAFAARLFTAENRIASISRPLPLPAPVLLLAAVLIVLAAARLYRRLTLQPADMTAIRYVARIRNTLPARIISGAALVVLFFAGGRLIVAAFHILIWHRILAIDSFPFVAAAAAALLFSLCMACLAAAGAVHAKVLVFDDEVRLKSVTYRSTIIPGSHIRGPRLVTGAKSLHLRRPALWPGAGGVFMELQDGSGYLLRTREPDALLAALHNLVQRVTVTCPSTRLASTSRAEVDDERTTAVPAPAAGRL
jgi:predicted Zn-dependent peptidase